MVKAIESVNEQRAINKSNNKETYNKVNNKANIKTTSDIFDDEDIVEVKHTKT